MQMIATESDRQWVKRVQTILDAAREGIAKDPPIQLWQRDTIETDIVRMALAMRRARKSGNFVFYTMDAFRIAQIAAIAAADLPEANANQRVAELQAMIDALKLEQERVMSKS